MPEEEIVAWKIRDPYIIHLNIALYMVVPLYFGGKSNASNGQHVSFKEPAGALKIHSVCFKLQRSL